jgi:nitrate reductase gamma subunit
MGIIQALLWMIYPYMVAVIFTMGIVWNCDTTELYRGNNKANRKSNAFRHAVKGFIFLSTATGISILLFNGFDKESIQLFQWLVSLILLRPDMELIMNLSILARMHIVLVLTSLLLLSFTKYINYLLHPLLYYRKQSLKISQE